jgi:non-homologous end joining protein Ku
MTIVTANAQQAQVINLMDALRRSVDVERGGGERRKASRGRERRAPKKAGRSSARQKTAG